MTNVPHRSRAELDALAWEREKEEAEEAVIDARLRDDEFTDALNTAAAALTEVVNAEYRRQSARGLIHPPVTIKRVK